MIYWQLFLSFLQIGMFSFGGGYAALPLIQEQVVTQHGWLSRSEFTDLITISQMTPGPIAVNSATFVGIRLAGFLGALAATFGCILPSCILVTVLSYLYLKYRKMSMLQGVLETLRVDDRGGRRIDPDHCVLERRGELYVDEVGFDRDFCCRSMAVKKEKLESDSCDGAERFCKAGSAGCACAGWHSMIR